MPATDSLGHLQTRAHKHVGERSNGTKRTKELAHAIMNSFDGMEARKNKILTEGILFAILTKSITTEAAVSSVPASENKILTEASLLMN